jgi:ABC-type polysaccharide/polyol phosphate transport system ATPase subunit
MSEVAIKVEGLGKRYKIGKLQRRHDTLRDRIADARVFNLFKRRNGNSTNGHGSIHHSALSSDARLQTSDSETLWALKNVSFEIKRGEVVGVIGRNGAGKSTLLKILSRITEPTKGHADINGRVGSLLEVGTGFHPELTGRENIYLNGSILGMKRVEIKNKFDEIVAFAEVEKFIDTPVKYYSSGMYVRLAFAVAAHMGTEILLVDEVLAVGDIKFQEKCMGKMGEVASLGRTILFVSHNLSSITRLCSDAILLQQGVVKSIGKPVAVVRDHMTMLHDSSYLRSCGSDPNLHVEARILDGTGKPTIVWAFDEKIIIEVDVSTRQLLFSPAIDVTFYAGMNFRLFSLQSDRLGKGIEKLTGHWRVRFEVENPGIIAAEILIDVGLREGSGGAYRQLITNVGMLSSDPKTIPRLALPNCLLYPKVLVQWETAEIA